MRILIVGSKSEYAIEKPYAKYLSQIDQVSHVEIFAAQNIFLSHYQKTIFNKVIYRAGLSSILVRINNELKIRIAQLAPDVVFVFKGMEIFPETLKWMKSRGIKLVNYNPDNPFIFSGKGSGNSNLRSSIPFYDLHFTYNQAVKARIEDEYGASVKMLPFGFDIEDRLYAACVDQDEIMRACFLGNPDKFRSRFVRELARHGIQIDVYGNGWGSYINDRNVKVYASVYRDGFWKTLRAYRVQLNLMRPHNLDAHNMRTFEVPGVGGIQLAPNTTDHRAYFNPGSNIFLFNDIMDCREAVARLMALTPEEAESIRDSARRHSILSSYTYKDRARKVFEDLRLLLA